MKYFEIFFHTILTCRSVLIFSLLLLINTICFRLSHAQNTEHFNFKHLLVKDGLSQSSIMSIFKDSDGFMWIGTKDGLNRFDGYEFISYNQKIPHLTGHVVNSISEDLEGILWIGTTNGLFSFDRKTESYHHFYHDDKDQQSLSDNHVLSTLVRSNGDLWIGTRRGLNKRIQETNQFLRYKSDMTNQKSISNNHINTLYEDADQNLWIGTKYGGLNRLIEGSEYTFTAPFDTADNNRDIRAILKIGKSLWIGTGDGLYILNQYQVFQRFEQAFSTNDTLSNEIIRTMGLDEMGNLWIGTYNGLNYIDMDSGDIKIIKNDPTRPRSLSHNSIRSLYIEDTNMLWIGTHFGGLNILQPQADVFKHYFHNPLSKNTISYNVVSAMVEDNMGNLWIGTEGGGLNYYDFQNESFNQITSFGNESIEAQTIKSLLLDSENNLWIGTHSSGLLKFDLDQNRMEKFELDRGIEYFYSGQKSIIELYEDFDNRIWASTNSGLFRFDKAFTDIEKIDLNNDNVIVNSIFRDSDKNLWLGTQNFGLILYDSEKLTFYQNNQYPNSINHNIINDIHEDEKGNLWIGSNGGLNKFLFEKSQFIDVITSHENINNIVYRIEEDYLNNLWLSSPAGLTRYNPFDNTFEFYDLRNELPISEFNKASSFKHSNNQLFFGGFNGLLSFDPQRLINNQKIPSIQLKRLKLSNKEITVDDETGILSQSLLKTHTIEFQPRQNIFTIEYAALNYREVGTTQYAYKLEGLETDWNYVGQRRFAIYSNLSPGTYTFKVKAANKNGLWGDQYASLTIIKKPFIWFTPLAYTIYGIILILLVFGVRKYFLIKLNLENKLKLQKLEKQQLENLNKLELQYFTNIAHDFRTPLTLILGPLQELKSKTKNMEFSYHLELIRKNVNLMLRLINQLMDFRKLSTGKMSLVVKYDYFLPCIKNIALSFKHLAVTNEAKYSVNSNISNIKIWYDKDKIEKIIYNLLSNAFKHTERGGVIKIEVHKKERDKKEWIDIKVYNTGVGISHADKENIFNRFYQANQESDIKKLGSGIGLSFVKDLVQLHQGKISIDSQVGKYTSFTVSIPAFDAYKNGDKVLVKMPSDINFKIYKGIFEAENTTNGADVPNVEKTKILVVEDEDELRRFISLIFSSKYDVLTASDGKQGIEIAKKELPDLIISDILMPEVSGTDLCKELKSNSRTNHIPIVLITARVGDKTQIDSYEIGADDFITKPFDIQVIKSKVSNLINTKMNIIDYSRQRILLNKKDINNSTSQQQFFIRLSEYLRKNIEDPDLNVQKTSKALGLSRVHLYRRVKTITGKSPNKFIRDFRLSVAVELLKQKKYNINEICYKTGFKDVTYFRKCFKEKFNVAASYYLNQTSELIIN